MKGYLAYTGWGEELCDGANCIWICGSASSPNYASKLQEVQLSGTCGVRREETAEIQTHTNLSRFDF